MAKEFYGWGIPGLPWAEQRRLIRLAQQGDRAAHDRLVRSFVGMALKESARWQRHSDDRDELCHVALVAVSDAVMRFRPSDGNRLSTVAATYIRNAMLKYRQDQCVMRIPVSSYNRNAPPHIAEFRDRALSTRSIDVPNADGRMVADVLVDPVSEPIDQLRLDEAEAERVRIVALVNRAVDRLPARQRHVLRARMLGQTLADIAAGLDVSKERIRQIETAARYAVRDWLLASGEFRWP